MAAWAWYWQKLWGGVCVCLCVGIWHGGIAQTSILLDSCSLPSDASHLRHRHWHPSNPSACRSLLIDLSLDRGVWKCFGGEMHFDKCSVQDHVLNTKQGGALTEIMLSVPRGELLATWRDESFEQNRGRWVVRDMSEELVFSFKKSKLLCLFSLILLI